MSLTGAVSWKPWVPILTWITGWINVSGWVLNPHQSIGVEVDALQVALVASGGLLGSQLIVGIISFMSPVGFPKGLHF